ncbi:YegP family protein [Chryseobacterium profundimaris]|uniref:DUF1508 domain-containing protein n=1 Tax=Chryseobacterium profundimaris TaxID=1387275 RepID=A0ABY1P8T0_9FLAO|nr:YegP family protein [Chryseobacterium profundimaris]SMP27728.1 hypothetical protein SAMN06264346_11019 [Chryseobacterium profundimaris]
MGKYIIRKSFDGKYWWVLTSPNGENLLTSETYTSKESCLDGVQISRESLKASNFKMLMTPRKFEPYFTQIADNYKILAKSEIYSTAYERDAATDTVKHHAADAVIEDLS